MSLNAKLILLGGNCIIFLAIKWIDWSLLAIDIFASNMNMVMGNYSNANIVPFISGTQLERFIGVSMIYLRLSFDISRSELWEYFY